LQKTLNELGAKDGVEYEVEVSKEDKEPLVVV
jgi:hypothetical protein